MKQGSKIPGIEISKADIEKNVDGEYEFKLLDVWSWLEKQLHRIFLTAVEVQEEALKKIELKADEGGKVNRKGLPPIEKAPETFTISKAGDCVAYIANLYADGPVSRVKFGDRESEKNQYAVSMNLQSGLDDKKTGEGNINKQLLAKAGTTDYGTLTSAISDGNIFKKRTLESLYENVEEKDKDERRKKKQAIKSEITAQQIRRRIKGKGLSTDFLVDGQAALDRITAIACLCESYRNPSNIAYLLVTLYLVKKGELTWSDAIDENNTMSYPPSAGDAQKKLFKLCYAVRDSVAAKNFGQVKIPDDLVKFVNPYQKSLGRFLVMSSGNLSKKPNKVSGPRQYGSLSKDFKFSDKTITESKTGDLVVQAASLEAARKVISSLLYEKLLRHIASEDITGGTRKLSKLYT